MEFNRESMHELRADLEATLALVAKKHAIKLTLGSGEYHSLRASYTLFLEQTGEEAERAVLAKQEEEFKRLAPMFGLLPEWYNRELTLRGTRFTIVGIAPNRNKNSVKIQRFDGKGFICPPSTIIRVLTQNQ